MANFTLLRPDNSSCFFAQTPPHSRTPLIQTSFQRLHFHHLSSPSNLRHRILCSNNSTQQNVEETQSVSKAKANALTDDHHLQKVSRNWPPWKNLPQRYKVIGT